MATKKKKITTEEKETTPLTDKRKYFYANGKRKSAIAKVKIFKGTGEITINNKTLNEYFPIKHLITVINSAFILTGSKQKYDTSAQVYGGGISSQAEALRHGISKALTLADPLNKPTLKKAGFLTRDSRIKERKKYGLKRARKGPQFSKR